MKNSTGVFRKELLPAPRAFYQREFGSALGRERRGWAQTKCCFHDGRSKTSLSLNMDGGGFKCFSCGIHGGDLISFVRKRYGLDFRGACKELGCWDESGSATRAQIARERKAREDAKAKQLEAEEAERQARIEARTCLHSLERSYAKLNLRLATLRRGAAEKFQGETDYCWTMLSSLTDKIRRAEQDYSRLAGVGGE